MDHEVSADEQTPPMNQTPGFLKDGFDAVLWFLQSYGWFIVLGIAVALYFKGHVQRAFNRWSSSHQDDTHLHRYDTDAVLTRQLAMDEARRRMQEQFDAQAARHAEEMKLKEEEKRRQKIEDWNRHLEGRGYRSKYRPPDENSDAANSKPSSSKKKPVYRTSDYNPLAGDGSSGGYRPERRGGAAGGGG